MQFHIDSAFLTDIARSWFWNEKMPYKKSEELLMCCLNTDKLSLEEKKAICKDVIEGRKKFVGIDECQIVDDGKNVRTIDEDYNVFVHSNKDSKDSGAPLAFASFCDDYPNREWTIFHI